MKIYARECATKELYSSDLVPIKITLKDLNDNVPTFTQTTYFASIDPNQINNNQKLLAFQVIDNDSGVYGVAGLKCNLSGAKADKFVLKIFNFLKLFKKKHSIFLVKLKDFMLILWNKLFI